MSQSIYCVDGDTPRGQFVQQLRDRLRYLTVSRYDDGPFQVFSKFFRYDSPLIEARRRGRSDLNDRPVSTKFERNLSSRQWTLHDKMIRTVYENPYHDVHNDSNATIG